MAIAVAIASATVDDEILCYICYDEATPANPFMAPSPCVCRGSLHLHRTCYNRLLELAAAEGKPANCSICKTRFTQAAAAASAAYIDFDETDENGIRRKGTRNSLTGAYDGLLCAYHSNGEHWFTVEYTNGVRDGPYMEWYEDGTDQIMGSFRAGELDGPYKEFWSNGKLRMETIYNNGEHDSSYLEYTDTGILITYYEYDNGMRHGPFELYDIETGMPRRRGEYRYGSLHGEEFTYYTSGNLESHSSYIQGTIDGIATTFYDAPGARESVITWVRGENMHATYYKEDGTVDRITRKGKRV